MPAKIITKHLLRISKSYAEVINHYRYGVEMARVSGLSIDALAEQACKDRFKFAKRNLTSANWAMALTPPQYRIALTRAYYSMYHAARAVVYFIEKGDDRESHLVLPKHIPNDFPDKAIWENNLKNARLERNKADYDPYPTDDRAFRSTAVTNVDLANEFLPLAKKYLVRKGCAL